MIEGETSSSSSPFLFGFGKRDDSLDSSSSVVLEGRVKPSKPRLESGVYMDASVPTFVSSSSFPSSISQTFQLPISCCSGQTTSQARLRQFIARRRNDHLVRSLGKKKKKEGNEDSPAQSTPHKQHLLPTTLPFHHRKASPPVRSIRTTTPTSSPLLPTRCARRRPAKPPRVSSSPGTARGGSTIYRP